MFAKMPAALRPSALDEISLRKNDLRAIKTGIRTNTDEIALWARERDAEAVGSAEHNGIDNIRGKPSTPLRCAPQSDVGIAPPSFLIIATGGSE
jgi:hypothetical protein